MLQARGATDGSLLAQAPATASHALTAAAEGPIVRSLALVSGGDLLSVRAVAVHVVHIGVRLDDGMVRRHSHFDSLVCVQPVLHVLSIGTAADTAETAVAG